MNPFQGTGRVLAGAGTGAALLPCVYSHGSRFWLNPIFEGFREREGSYGSPEGCRLLRDGTRLPPNAWPNVAQDPGKVYPRALQLNRLLTRLATGERSTL